MESEPSPAYLQTGFDRLEQERRAMLILLGWGAANIIAGGALAAKKPYKDFWAYDGRMGFSKRWNCRLCLVRW